MPDRVVSKSFPFLKIRKGESNLAVDLDTYAIAFPTDSDYNVESELTYTVGAKMFLGNNAQQTITSLTATSSDGDVYTSGTSPANGVNITIGESRFVDTVQITVTATCAKGSRTATINLTPTPQGETGARGKVGRFFYYAGELNDFASTDSFLVNDAQAPYFHYNNNYWVFNPETNGTYTKQDMGTPSSSSVNWQMMTNDFKYIITEAIFGSYAHFGSAIINEDWMMSTNGYVNGSAYNNTNVSGSIVGGSSFAVKAYTLFDSSYPLGENTSFHSSDSTTSVSSTQTSVTRASSIYLYAGQTYYLSCTGKTSNASHPIYGRIQDGSGNYCVPVNINSTSSVVRGGYFRVLSNGNYSIILTQDSGYTGEVTLSSIIRVRFAPNYCVDLLTGKSYQNDAYIKGQIVATSGSIDSISATNLNIKSGTITGDVTIGDLGVNIKLKPTGSGTGVGASIVAYDGAETPFSLLFDRYTYNGTYHPHANLTLKSTAPYNSKYGNIEITDTQSKRTLYYGNNYIPDAAYTLYEGYESITNFSGFVSKLSYNNAYHLRIGITNTGVACIIADALPLASNKSSIPTGCIYRDGENLKIKV